MTLWNIRISLARKGWHTNMRLAPEKAGNTAPNIVSFGFWAKRGYWKGWLQDICFHDHVVLDLEKPGAYRKAFEIAAGIAEACERASLEYPDSIPCQMHEKFEDGRHKLVTNSWDTGRLTGPRDAFPTEDIPEGIEHSTLPQDEDHLSQMIKSARAGYYVEDDINTYFGYSRMARDCENRKWGYKLRLDKRSFNGVALSFQPHKFTVESLHEAQAAALIEANTRALEHLLHAYGPDGPMSGFSTDGLPPGEMTLAAALAKDS